MIFIHHWSKRVYWQGNGYWFDGLGYTILPRFQT